MSGSDWYTIKDNKIAIVLDKYLTWANACSDEPITLDLRFRYMSAGGTVSGTNQTNMSDYYDSSKITIQAFDKSLAESLLSLIENNSDLQGETGNIRCKLTLNKGFTADGLVIKPNGDQMAADQIEKVDSLPDDWDIVRPTNLSLTLANKVQQRAVHCMKILSNELLFYLG